VIEDRVDRHLVAVDDAGSMPSGSTSLKEQFGQSAPAREGSRSEGFMHEGVAHGDGDACTSTSVSCRGS